MINNKPISEIYQRIPLKKNELKHNQFVSSSNRMSTSKNPFKQIQQIVSKNFSQRQSKYANTDRYQIGRMRRNTTNQVVAQQKTPRFLHVTLLTEPITNKCIHLSSYNKKKNKQDQQLTKKLKLVKNKNKAHNSNTAFNCNILSKLCGKQIQQQDDNKQIQIYNHKNNQKNAREKSKQFDMLKRDLYKQQYIGIQDSLNKWLQKGKQQKNSSKTQSQVHQITNLEKDCPTRIYNNTSVVNTNKIGKEFTKNPVHKKIFGNINDKNDVNKKQANQSISEVNYSNINADKYREGKFNIANRATDKDRTILKNSRKPISFNEVDNKIQANTNRCTLDPQQDAPNTPNINSDIKIGTVSKLFTFNGQQLGRDLGVKQNKGIHIGQPKHEMGKEKGYVFLEREYVITVDKDWLDDLHLEWSDDST